MPNFLIIRATDQHIMTRASSTEEAQALVHALSYEHGEKFFFKPEPDMEWRLREEARFGRGEYKNVPWYAEPWWRNRSDEILDHYAHISSEKPDMIAFTESPEKGELDRQTRIRAGAYLQRFFSHALDERQIAEWARAMARSVSDDVPALQIASTPDHVRYVYENGPDSCMSMPAERYATRNRHPVEVYGDSDLAVAYIERRTEYQSNPIASRAVIWPERKLYGRVYPTPERYSGTSRTLAKAEHDALIRALESVGYRNGRFEGARIRAIPVRNSDTEFVMPYLDGLSGLNRSDCGKWFVISSTGDLSAQNTHGTISTEDSYRCEFCEEAMDEDYSYSVNVGWHSTQSWCEHCVSNNAFYCHGTDEHYSDSDYCSVEVNGAIYSERYAERNFTRCERTDEWFDREDIVEVNTGYTTENWCMDEAQEFAFYCNIGCEWYANDDYEKVEIDGETYEKSNAMDDEKLKAKLAEMESEESE